MAALTKKEILAGLKKLGISSTSELDSYCREYNEFLTLQDIRHSPQEYRRKIKCSYPRRGTSTRRTARISHSFMPAVDSRTFSKVKASRKMK